MVPDLLLNLPQHGEKRRVEQNVSVYEAIEDGIISRLDPLKNGVWCELELTVILNENSYGTSAITSIPCFLQWDAIKAESLKTTGWTSG